MKRIILLFGLIFSLVAVKATAGETPTNEQKAHNQSLSMQKVLSLSAEQQVKVEAVLLSKYVATDAVINDVNTSGAEKLAALEVIKQNKDAELAAIMTPEQYALFVQKRDDVKARKEANK
ncbi:MAG: hypothetical protein M3R17_10130 [Bacteroidota bacterium]|nr:hypothetical protein [Bacteroidota bacterium]